MDPTIRKNQNFKKGITCTLCNAQVPGINTDNSFTNHLDVLKKHFKFTFNLAGIFAVNTPQRNCSVYNKRPCGNIEIRSTIANHLRVFHEIFQFLENLELADDSPIIGHGEIIFLKIPAFNLKLYQRQ